MVSQSKRTALWTTLAALVAMLMVAMLMVALPWWDAEPARPDSMRKLASNAPPSTAAIEDVHEETLPIREVVIV